MFIRSLCLLNKNRKLILLNALQNCKLFQSNQKQNKTMKLMLRVLLTLFLFQSAMQSAMSQETAKAEANRMDWWREARFGMFIHWGLYSIPAGEWKGETDHAEWIRTTAKIPVEEYDKFVQQFNPVKFNAEDWVKTAKDAGMKYIVLTSKHHDGFCLFDSKYTDFDVMSTPFKRDILKELSDACRKYDMKICWYHSIMDWHNDDYLPRRDWETNRPSDSTSFNRYFGYLENQVKEIITNYGDISVLWFDGEWESTWSHEYAIKLYNFIRAIDPDIIINNRIDVYREGMGGLSSNTEALGDYGTPEQEIPETGVPGKDWESCMTMNDHWGYNKFDNHWKSARELIYNLADIASKGGNYLLNVGPTSEGVFPQASLDRLKTIGAWMKVNGTSIYGTQASPFKKAGFGKCTQRETATGTRLYLHVFDWPKNRKLLVPDLLNEPVKAFLLSDKSETPLSLGKRNGSIEINLPELAPDSLNSVIVLDIKGKPDVLDAPQFSTKYDPGTDMVLLSLVNEYKNPKVSMYYTTDGTDPSDKSELYTKPVQLKLPLNVKSVLYYATRKFGDISTLQLPVSFGKLATFKNPPSQKYAASGAASLTDGLHGKVKFTSGNWLGFDGKDFEAILDMGKKMNIHSASLSYLVCTRSWIFEPVEILIEASPDGKEFKPVLSKKFNPAMWKSADAVKEFSDVFPAVNARYIRFTAKNRGTCPPGHPGSGDKAWIFVDEITVE
jgi:alpha-L-fucosidase